MFDEMYDKVKNIFSEIPENYKITSEDGEIPKSKEELDIEIIKKMLEKLTGKKIKMIKLDDLKKLSDKIEKSGKEIEKMIQPELVQNVRRVGWGMEYNYSKTVSEYEKVNFSASGNVKTSDGKEISFDVSLLLERSFYKNENLSVKMGDAAIDPLVINFDGNSAELSNSKFKFDIDSDGTEDNISYLKKGSGFLVIDRNNDGIINNGSEMFGPETGNGFGELSEYDEDGNGWIDENDSVFKKLKIWIVDDEGNNKLLGLLDKDIGAIYTGSSETLFHLRNAIDEQNGILRRTGVYLNENGFAGMIQHIDFNV